MTEQDVERIARATLKDLGAAGAGLTVTPVDGQPGHWRIEIEGGNKPGRLRVTCGEGSTAHWIRQQIYEQYLS